MGHLKLILDGMKQGDKNGGPTELAKILSDSLLACEGFDKKDLISRYLHWWKTDAFDTGPTFAMVFEKVSNGAAIEKAVEEVDTRFNGNTAGCGPAHRIAPLSALKTISNGDLVRLSREEAKITHQHPDAGNCSAVMALFCRHLLEGHDWNDSKNLLHNNEDIKSTWLNIQNANLNNSGYVLDVMHTSIYFLDMDNSLEKSLSFAGPANYCPVIVGILDNIRKQKKILL